MDVCRETRDPGVGPGNASAGRAARALAAAALVASLACGGGGGGGGGGVVADDSTVSQGPISEIGSARVAGTLWNTTAVPAKVTFDETEVGDPSQLFPGMLARIQGQRDAGDPTTATANTVRVYDAVEGPIESVTVVDSDQTEIVVVGRTVVVLDGFTAFGSAMGIGSYTFADLAPDDLVEVWGLLDGDVVQATRIEKYGDLGGAANVGVELTGVVENLDDTPANGGSFELNGVKVDYLDAVLDDVPGGENGLVGTEVVVGVKGVFNIAGNSIGADDVHLRGPLAGDIPGVEIDGIVSGFTSFASLFRVGGQIVDVSLLTSFVPASLENDPVSDFRGLTNGMRVKASGLLAGGTLAAEVMSFRDEEVLIAAQIATPGDIDVGAGTVTLLDGITVRIDNGTRLSDDKNANPFSLANLVSGDFLEVRGIDLDGEVLATSLVRKSAPGIIRVRGRVEDFLFSGPPFGYFSMLGLDLLNLMEAIPTDSNTTYSEFPGMGVATQTAFYAFLLANPGALIQVTDNTGSAAAIDVANHIEYEDE